MIHFDPPDEPPTFAARCRARGNAHILAAINGTRKNYWRDFWSEFRPDLGDGFKWICGYSGIKISKGSVDHYRSKGANPRNALNPHLAYEWTNFRFADAEVNNDKRKELPGEPLVLDPFEVENGWFEIKIPSLFLEYIGPEAYRVRAEHTLKKMKLRNGDAIMRLRQGLFSSYIKGNIDIIYVQEMMPLLADALIKHAPPKNGTRFI